MYSKRERKRKSEREREREREREKGEDNRTMHDIAFNIFTLQITNNRLARTSILEHRE